jgi:hypothetical protein
MAKSILKSARGRARAQRLVARVTAEQKALIEHAAALQGGRSFRAHQYPGITRITVTVHLIILTSTRLHSRH